jgi:hypothetical protein
MTIFSKTAWIALLLPVFAQAMPTQQQCESRPPAIPNPGFGIGFGREDKNVDLQKIYDKCQASYNTSIDKELAKQYGACVDTLTQVQKHYNEYLTDRGEFCKLLGAIHQACPSGQRECFQRQTDMLTSVRAKLAELNAYLKNLKDNELQHLRQYNVATAQQIAEAVEQMAHITNANGHLNPDAPNRGAERLGESTPRQVVQRNTRGDPLQRVQAFKELIETANRSGISQSQLQDVESPAIREQLEAVNQTHKLQNGAQAEMDYNNALSRDLLSNQQQIAESQERVTSMGGGGVSPPPAASSSGFDMNDALKAGQMAQLAGAAANQGQRGAASAPQGTTVSGLAPIKNLTESTGSANPLNARAAETTLGITDPKASTKSDAEAKTNGTGSSIAARDKLRRELSSNKRNGSGSSRMPTSVASAPVLDKNGKAVRKKDGTILTQGELAQSNGVDGEMGLSFGNIDMGADAGMDLAGSETDTSVKGLVDEMKAAYGIKQGNTPMGAEFMGSREIMAADSSALFDRIRELHSRCLKKGCVLGKK